MIILIITIFIYIIFIHKIIFKYKVGKGNIVLIFANIGSGKTTLLAKIAQDELRRIKKGVSSYIDIVSNVHIKGVKYVPDIRELLKQGMLIDTLILLDEGSIVYNNRAMNLTKMEIEEFKLIRHYECSLVVLSQDFEDIDITLRRLYTQIFILKNIGNVINMKKVKKFITIDEETQSFVNGYEYTSFLFGNTFIYRPFYYHLFDSYTTPDYIPLLNTKDNTITYLTTGETKDIEKKYKFIQLESADNMTRKEKLNCNRNIKRLLDSKIFKLKKGKLVLDDKKYKKELVHKQELLKKLDFFESSIEEPPKEKSKIKYFN